MWFIFIVNIPFEIDFRTCCCLNNGLSLGCRIFICSQHLYHYYFDLINHLPLDNYCSICCPLLRIVCCIRINPHKNQALCNSTKERSRSRRQDFIAYFEK